jgi:hypothetical protein
MPACLKTKGQGYDKEFNKLLLYLKNGAGWPRSVKFKLFSTLTEPQSYRLVRGFLRPFSVFLHLALQSSG